MDNVFLTQYFDWNRAGSRKVRWVNKLLAAMGLHARLTYPQATGEQTSIEQRINLYHLASSALEREVVGDFIEVGTFLGSTAVLLQEVLRRHPPVRQLHVYDAFIDSSPSGLTGTFDRLKLPPPTIHVGRCQETLPDQLPQAIAFAHLDVGWKQPFEEHRDTVLACVQAIYPRMSRGAVCVIADYCEPDVYARQNFEVPSAVAASQWWSHYPSTKAACDLFFADKPEKMTLLYGGPYSHGYFRKGPIVNSNGGASRQ